MNRSVFFYILCMYRLVYNGLNIYLWLIKSRLRMQLYKRINSLNIIVSKHVGPNP